MKPQYVLFLIMCLLGISASAQIQFEEIIAPAPSMLYPFDGIRDGDLNFTDVDGDGDKDLFIIGYANVSNEFTKLYENDGNGNFSSFSGNSFIKLSSGSSDFADIDGDNDLDLVITGSENSVFPRTKLYVNDGAGIFSELSNTGILDVQDGLSVFADLDGDGDQDLIINGKDMFLDPVAPKFYENNGNGVFTEFPAISFNGFELNDIAVADVDNDGDLDIFITGENNTNDDITSIYLNDGNAVFTEYQEIPFSDVAYSGIYFQDVDNDDDLDVLLVGTTSSTSDTKLFKNDGLGNFTEEMQYSGLSRAKFVDIDGDGDQDMVSYSFPGISVRINNGSGIFSEPEQIVSLELIDYIAFAFEDIDGDNDSDLLLTGLEATAPTGGFDRGISNLYENIEGEFSLVPKPFNEGFESGAVAFADIDGDSDLDVCISGVGEFGRISRLYGNDGNGGFTEFEGVPFEKLSGSGVAFADVDGDDDQDILFAGFSDFNEATTSLYINDGAGNYTESIANSFEGLSSGSVAFSDIDNDGDQDVLISGYSYSGSMTKLYLNNGTGIFTELAEVAFAGNYSGVLSLADVDGDNDEDLLITGRFATKLVKYYKNNGNTNFVEIQNHPFDAVDFSAAAFADIDGDNDLDLLCSGLTDDSSRQTKIYTNNGNGVFTELTDTPFENVDLGTVSFSDVDNDGDQDVLITGRLAFNSSTAKLYENDGTGTFSEVTEATFDDVDYSTVAFADIDGDNNEDLFIAGRVSFGGKSSKLYRNLSGEMSLAQNDILSFSISGQIGTTQIDVEDASVKIIVENGTDLSTLVPSFTLSENAIASIDDQEQLSSVSAYDYTTPVNFTVTSASGIAKIWTIEVTEFTATNYYVKANGLGLADGSSALNAAPYIHTVIDMAVAGDSIKIMSGIVTENSDVSIPNGVLVYAMDGVIVDMNDYHLENNGHFTISATASLVQTTGSVSGEGKFEVIRKSGTNVNMFNFLSSPIDHVHVQSVYGGSNVLSFAPVNHNNGLNGWNYITSGVLNNGEGYAVSGSVQTNFSGYRHYQGMVNNGNISVALDGTAYGSAFDGWNLIGNPYPSAINILAFINSNVDVSAVTLYNQLLNNYQTYNIVNADDLDIPSGQAFYVEYSEANSGIALFENTHRSLNVAGSIAKSVAIASSRLRIRNSDHYYDSYIAFTDNASDGYNHDYDARLISNAGPISLYSLLNEEAFAIQTLGGLYTNKTIPLGFEAAPGLHHIEMIDFIDFPENASVVLIDNETGITHDIKSEAYSFIVSDLGINEARFQLHYRNNLLNTEAINKEETKLYLSMQDQSLYVHGITTDQITNINIYEISGKLVISTSAIESTDQYAKVVLNSLKSGLYIVELNTNEKQIVLPLPRID